MEKKTKLKRVIICAAIIMVLLLVTAFFHPTWTPGIKGENSISELRKVRINDVDLQLMIRGKDADNPVVLFVHGGPCCSEIPYARKYQGDLEENFTIVHYDQRGSGKSYKFGTDYSDVTAETHVEDLISLTEYIEEYLNQDKVILAGHSYGTYIATMAAAKTPELYRAYVGIGQLSNTVESELDSLQKCIEAAEEAGNTEDVTYLKSVEVQVSEGKMIAPREYVKEYGFAARQIDENSDYYRGFFFGSEYNLLDAVRFFTSLIKYQDELTMETVNKPVSDIVTEISIPVYFVMGKYDGMTSPKAAEEYLNNISGHETREMVIFKNSAHYPQFEEPELFSEWMCDTFR